MKNNFSIRDTADILSASERTVYHLISDGEIIAFKVRGALRVIEPGFIPTPTDCKIPRAKRTIPGRSAQRG